MMTMSNRKYTQAGSTHIGYTAREVKSTVHGYEFTVPAGTLCRKLSTHWVVEDLAWLAKKEGRHSISFHDADHYGITVDETDLERIEPKIIQGY